MIFRIILVCSVLMCSMGMKVHTELPVADVFELMDEINLVKKDALWPGFYPGEIPTAIFDGINTYLFKHPSPPEAFMVLREKEEAWVFKGQHGQVRGNSRVQLNGIWTATSVLRTHSRLTGEKYSMQNLAGIIIHEQFHVFQRLKHPDWRPNDGHLFNFSEGLDHGHHSWHELQGCGCVEKSQKCAHCAETARIEELSVVVDPLLLRLFVLQRIHRIRIGCSKGMETYSK